MSKAIKTEVNEKKLATMGEKFGGTVETIEALQITNDKDMAYASELLSQANKHLDALEADRTALTKPLNAVLRGINAKYKPLSTKLEKAVKHLRKEIGAYQTKQEEEKAAKETAVLERVGAGKGKLKVETAAKQIAKIDGPEQKVETASGSISFRDDYEVTVTDIRQVPEEYLTVDIAGIKKAIKDKKDVPGIEYKTIKVPINRR